MSMNILNDISSVYVKEVIEPQLGKKEAPAAAPTGGAKKVEKGKTGIEASAKRIRQAVYDIRYRARREGIELDKAYNQYMAHTTMSGPEKTAVKEKLGIGPGGGSVNEESKPSGAKKFQVRVTDKESGKTYVRYATREKINQLRGNPNISSVEMTQYGKPYEGEKERGEYTAKAKAGKGLDPVGQEDKDIDNDGDHDKTDKYLLNRRKVRGAAIAKKPVKEGFSNWRQDLHEIMDTLDSPDDVQNKKTQIKENPKINNKVVINPEFKESVENLGGHLIEMVELDEEFITSSINVATEYFYEQGLNEEGIDILIEELGVDNFVDFVFEISEEFNLNEARTLLGKKKSPQKLPKGTAPSQTTKAAVAKYGTTKRFKGSPTSSTIKRKTVAVKKAVEKQPETKTASKQTKRGILDRVAGAVLKGMERHKAATSTASKLVSRTAQTVSKAAKVGAKGASEFGKGVASGVSGTATAAKKVKKAVVGEEIKLDEKTLTSAETKEKERIVKSMKDTATDFEARYPGRGKEVMYATATKMAKKLKESNSTDLPLSPQELQAQRQKMQLDAKIAKLRQQSLAKMKKPQPVSGAQSGTQQVVSQSFEMEGDQIDERRREDKGTPRGPEPSAAFKAVSAMMGSSRVGVQPRGKKKVPGQKPPAAGEYGSERRSPSQQVAMRRAAAERSREAQSSRFD